MAVASSGSDDDIQPRERERVARSLVRLVMVLALSALLVGPAQAQLGLVRDAEIERTVRDLSAPIFSAAGISPSSVRIYLIADDSLNAFVAGGQNLFLHTGLLARSETPEQLAGVIAHEAGHIAGGHLVRLSGAVERAAAEQILSALLGAAAIVAGAPELGQAVIMGGDQIARQGFLRFNRGQEQAADQAALAYLDATGLGAEGLLEFFRILDSQQMLQATRVSPYMQTHPLTRDRIAFIERHTASRPQQSPPDAETVERHRRMVAKVEAFLQQPTRVLQAYADDDSFAGRYARAIATYRLNDTNGALRLLEPLEAAEPSNPFLHELKGQILFESGRVGEAVAPYALAVQLAPREPLLRLGHGRALMESGNEAAAIEAFQNVVQAEPRNAFAWRMLGIARGRAGDLGPSNLALAEAAVLRGEFGEARLFLGRADQMLPAGGRERQQFYDLQAALEAAEREAQRR
jgi:predicted Zn-dependent protease